MRPIAQVSQGIAAVLAVGCAVLLAACAAPAPVTSSAAPVTPSAGVAAFATGVPAVPAAWRSHTDPRLGYALSFPEDVEFTSGTSKAGVYTARLQFSVPGVDGYQGMVLRVEPNPERRAIEQVAEDLYRRNLLEDPPQGWPEQLQKVTVAGLSGVQMGEEGDFSLVVPYEDQVYIIAPVHDEATTFIDPQALALFFQILGTLKISP